MSAACVTASVTTAASCELSLAHLTVLDTTPSELVTVTARAGFRKVGLCLYANPRFDMPPYDRLGDTPVLRETVQRMNHAGVPVLELEFLRFEPAVPPTIPLAIEAPVRESATLPAQERANIAYRRLTQLFEPQQREFKPTHPPEETA